MSDVPWSMCMSAYLSVATPVCPAKTNELIRDAVWEADLYWPEEPHLRWGACWRLVVNMTTWRSARVGDAAPCVKLLRPLADTQDIGSWVALVWAKIMLIMHSCIQAGLNPASDGSGLSCVPFFQRCCCGGSSKLGWPPCLELSPSHRRTAWRTRCRMLRCPSTRPTGTCSRSHR